MAEWLRASGLQVEQIWDNRLAISFSGSARTVENAFQVQLGLFQHPTEQRTFFANLQTPTLPAQIDAITISLVGLDNAILKHHPNRSSYTPISLQDVQAKIRPLPSADIGGTKFVGPKDLQFAYGYQTLISGGLNAQGSGQTEAIIIDSDVLNADINQLRTQLGLPALGTGGAALNRIVPPGLTNPGTRFEGEAELDVSTMSQVAPVSTIDLVLVPQLDSSSVLTAEQYVVNTLKPPVANESFGGCESFNYISSEETLFLQAKAQGIAFFASSGDEGAECGPGGTPGVNAVNLHSGVWWSDVSRRDADECHL